MSQGPMVLFFICTVYVQISNKLCDMMCTDAGCVGGGEAGRWVRYGDVCLYVCEYECV